MKWVWLGCFIATIYLANLAVDRLGIVSVGLGLMAPAGVYFVGLAFTFRDLSREGLGRWWIAAAIIVGALLSYWLADVHKLAIASGVAFLVSESADFAVYEPVRARSKILAVLLSNSVGLVIDSALFLWLAFGSLEFLFGQIWAKALMTLLAVLILGGARYLLREERGFLPRNTHTELAE